MGGFLVRDKNFWIIKYSKQSELPSKHLNFKTGAMKISEPLPHGWIS